MAKKTPFYTASQAVLQGTYRRKRYCFELKNMFSNDIYRKKSVAKNIDENIVGFNARFFFPFSPSRHPRNFEAPYFFFGRGYIGDKKASFTPTPSICPSKEAVRALSSRENTKKKFVSAHAPFPYKMGIAPRSAGQLE